MGEGAHSPTRRAGWGLNPGLSTVELEPIPSIKPR